MRLYLLLSLCILFILPFINGQENDGSERTNLNNKGPSDLETKNEDGSNVPSNGEDENKENKEKPRKSSFKEERFEKLFNSRNRNRKPRIPTPKFQVKPKPKLPSYLKNPPSVKPLGQDGFPVDDGPTKPTVAPSRAKVTNRSTINKATTSAPAISRTRTRATTSRVETTSRSSVSEDSRKRFLSGRGRNTNTPARTRINN